MEITLDGENAIFVLKHNDKGELLKRLNEHRINAMYDFSSGEYLFHNRSDYHAAVLLI